MLLPAVSRSLPLLGRASNSVYCFPQRHFTVLMPSKPFSFAMLSHPGRVRKGNEDVCAAAPEIGAFIVCDGMGGAAAGEVASLLASQTFLQAVGPGHEETPRTATPDIRLDSAIHAANQAVFLAASRSAALEGMGTTLVALLFEPAIMKLSASLTLAHVGDSRCYLYRAGGLTQLTEDHSLVEEQVRLGELTADEAAVHPMRNIITRAVGSQAEVEPEIRYLDPQPGDLYLLASDGLTRELTDAAIAQTFTRVTTRRRNGELELSSLCQTLVDQANDSGGGDNITVLLLQIR